MKILITSLLFLCFSNMLFGQQLDTLSLPQQFDKIYRISSKYQDYKVIRISNYLQLKDNVNDTLALKNKMLTAQKATLQLQRDSITDLTEINQLFSGDIKLLISEKNSVSVFGIPLHKTTYNLMMWGLVILLGTLLSVLVVRLKSNELTTKKATQELADLEEELRLQKKKSLENEQKLRRKLQDEINKKRGV